MQSASIAPAPGTVVLVTGGAHGIGREYCRAFSGCSARIAVADIDASGADAVARELGAEALGVQMDVSDERSVATAVSKVVARFGRVDVLVNNAAMYAVVPIRRAPLEELTVAEWDQVMAVNLRGTFLCTRAVVPVMKEHGGGRIINISSGTALNGSGALYYATSKAGVLGFTRTLARELGVHGINVNTLAPGVTDTESTSAEERRRHDSSVRSRAISRPETPRDLVGAVLFLASPAAAFMTGQTLVVDGGRAMP